MGSLSPNVTRYHIVVWNPRVVHHSKFGAQYLSRVNRVGFAMSALRRLILRKRPYSGHRWTSQKCHNRP
jgi:hypothetical protein